MNPIQPNFLIVGAAKCGTTSLHRYLSQHPQIFMPEWKELSLFIDDPHGPLHRVPSPAVYYRLFQNAAGCAARGEASTAYLFNPGSPRLIQAALEDPRIIIILREPVAMSYSLYHHEFRKEGETFGRFEDALAVESRRMKDPAFARRCFGWHANYYYVHRGLYAHQVGRYLERFDPGRICILLFEDLKHSPLATVQSLYRFLGVDDAFVPELKIYNRAGELLNVPRFWTDYGLFLKTALYAAKGNLIRKMPHLLRNLTRPRPPKMEAATAAFLRRRFRPDIERLETLIGRDLTPWK